MVLYALINDDVRVSFEKTLHLPFGYGNPEHCIILDDYQKALSLWHHQGMDPAWIIEKCEGGYAEKVFPPTSSQKYS